MFNEQMRKRLEESGVLAQAEQAVLSLIAGAKKERRRREMAEMTPAKIRQRMARIIREVATENLNSGLKTWRGEPDMINMVRGDSKDLREVAKLLLANKIDKARNKADSMDTAARELIPDEPWDFLHGTEGCW